MTQNFDESKVRRGQPSNRAQFRVNERTNPEAGLTPPVYGTFHVPAVDVRLGDTAFNEVVIGADARDGEVELTFATGDTVQLREQDRVNVTRTEQTVEDYFDIEDEPLAYRIGTLAHPNTTAESLQNAATSSETDITFTSVIARHPNTGEDTLDLLAEHHAPDVRRHVAAHPNTTATTVEDILGRSLRHLASARHNLELLEGLPTGELSWAEAVGNTKNRIRGEKAVAYAAETRLLSNPRT